MKKEKIIPSAFGDTLSLAGKSAGGLHLVGATVPVNHTTEELVRAIMASAIKANDEYQAAKAARLAAGKAQATSDDKCRALILTARDVLKPVLGARYSQAWNQAGFVTPSLAVPTTIAKRAARVALLQTYFDAHPDQEVPNLGVTEANAMALHDELMTNIDAFAAAKTTQRQKRTAYLAAFAALRAELQKLYRELKAVLAKDDPRWLEFGFGVPADLSVPNAPEGLALTLDAAGHVVASWGHTVNADRFRIYKRVIGTDTDYVLVDTTTAMTFDLGVFASGAHVEVQVIAVNASGESVPSDTKSVVVP